MDNNIPPVINGEQMSNNIKSNASYMYIAVDNIDAEAVKELLNEYNDYEARFRFDLEFPPNKQQEVLPIDKYVKILKQSKEKERGKTPLQLAKHIRTTFNGDPEGFADEILEIQEIIGLLEKKMNPEGNNNENEQTDEYGRSIINNTKPNKTDLYIAVNKTEVETVKNLLNENADYTTRFSVKKTTDPNGNLDFIPIEEDDGQTPLELAKYKLKEYEMYPEYYVDAINKIKEIIGLLEKKMSSNASNPSGGKKSTKKHKKSHQKKQTKKRGGKSTKKSRKSHRK